jgi:hypothetical protein
MPLGKSPGVFPHWHSLHEPRWMPNPIIRRVYRSKTTSTQYVRNATDKKLMSDQDGLSNDGTQTSRTGESKNGGNEMNEENNEIAHAAS